MIRELALLPWARVPEFMQIRFRPATRDRSPAKREIWSRFGPSSELDEEARGWRRP